MDHKKYMTTGEFAKRMGVTKNTLYHYDSIGLFSPELVDENEYRYYSVYQMEVFDTIIILKEMGMPLGEIKEFMDHRSPQRLLELFEKEDLQITEQIKRLKRRQQFIRGRKEEIKAIKKIDFSTVSNRYFPRRYYVYGEVTDMTDEGFYKKTNEMISAFERNNYYQDYDIGYLQTKKDIAAGIYDNYTNAVIVTVQKPKGMKCRVLEEGGYLTAYHKGHWKTIGSVYAKMMEYAEHEKIKLAPLFLETYMIDSLMAKSLEDYVTEISIRIET